MKLEREFLESRGLTPEKIADTMLEFYGEIDNLSAGLSERLEASGVKLKCRPGCCGCCADGLTVNRSEEAVIRKLFPHVLEETPHEPGLCPFLNQEGLCRIYEARPFICRTHGLPLKMVISREEASGMGISLEQDQEEAEFIDICEKNEEGVELEALPDDVFLDHNVCELKLATMEMATYGSEIYRINMRDLFKKKS